MLLCVCFALSRIARTAAGSRWPGGGGRIVVVTWVTNPPNRPSGYTGFMSYEAGGRVPKAAGTRTTPVSVL